MIPPYSFVSVEPVISTPFVLLPPPLRNPWEFLFKPLPFPSLRTLPEKGYNLRLWLHAFSRPSLPTPPDRALNSQRGHWFSAFLPSEWDSTFGKSLYLYSTPQVSIGCSTAGSRGGSAGFWMSLPQSHAK